jgi:hypothetical protein
VPLGGGICGFASVNLRPWSLPTKSSPALVCTHKSPLGLCDSAIHSAIHTPIPTHTPIATPIHTPIHTPIATPTPTPIATP